MLGGVGEEDGRRGVTWLFLVVLLLGVMGRGVVGFFRGRVFRVVDVFRLGGKFFRGGRMVLVVLRKGAVRRVGMG